MVNGSVAILGPIWRKSHKGRRGMARGGVTCRHLSAVDQIHRSYTNWPKAVPVRLPAAPTPRWEAKTGRWTETSNIPSESDSSLTEHRRIDQRETTSEVWGRRNGRGWGKSTTERERGREIEWESERGVNNIFISPRIYSRQSVGYH